MYGVYGSGASHYREGDFMTFARGDLVTLDPDKVRERAAARPHSHENARKIALADAGVTFCITDIKEGAGSVPLFLVRVVDGDLTVEQEEVLERVGPIAQVGELLCRQL